MLFTGVVHAAGPLTCHKILQMSYPAVSSAA